MLRLPSFRLEDTVYRLPLADATAGSIAETLVCDAAGERRQRLIATIRDDPALALWVACRGSDWRDRGPRDVAEIAGWLAEHAETAFVGTSGESIAHVDDAAQIQQRWHEIVRESVSAALGAEASESSDADRGAAYLRGLLSTAQRWLASCAEREGCGGELDESAGGEPALPKWLVAETPSNEGLVGEQRDRVARQAAEIAQRWSREAATASTLPQLVGKLARLRQLEQRFEATVEQQKLAALKELAYGASHEINNPLANISTRAQTLLREERDPERRRKLATINSQAFRAHEMIADMMLFAHPPQPKFEPIDVQEILDRAIEELKVEARPQGTKLVRLGGPAAMTAADPGQLLVALQALGRNAIEASGAGGQVEFSARAAEDGEASCGETSSGTAVEIIVRDTGPGIPADVRPHIFEPFYSGREAGRGLGFGLCKCWRIVTMHGGTIEVNSRDGHGAEFIIRLPAGKTARCFDALAASA